MNITFACPSCEKASRLEFDDSTESLACSQCQQAIEPPAEAVQGRRVTQCLVCPSRDLFMRKDFPQRLGVLLVVVGVVGSSIAWHYSNLYWTFGILFATALIDVLLYALVGDALMCYRCGAQYRGVEEMESHGQFDLETHERYRQMDARLSGQAS